MATTQTTTTTQAPRRLGGRWIDDWRPEDLDFWNAKGRAIAGRNLLFSVLSEHIGFSVWSLWSVIVLFLGPEYGIDAAGKFLLTALPDPGRSRPPGALHLRRRGVRRPELDHHQRADAPHPDGAHRDRAGTRRLLHDPALVAMTAGVGGGNFASSMTNINHYYPARLKGWALGVNAGGGNLGVPVVQLVGLLVLATLGSQHPRALVVIYIPLIILSAIGATLMMNNLAQASNAKGAIREVMRHRETWIMSLLYIGTFGSFIGFSFAFGQVLLVQFPEQFPTPVKAAALTFIGPLLGSLIRPVGGALADRFRGSVVTFYNFLVMALGAFVVLVAAQMKSLPLYLVGFVVLFVTSGIGNGSTYKMIPAIFAAKGQKEVGSGGEVSMATFLSTRRAGALIGLAGAIGAFGGVLVNLAFRQSYLTSKSGDGAVMAFIAFYAVCCLVTWAVFLRRHEGRLEGV